MDVKAFHNPKQEFTFSVVVAIFLCLTVSAIIAYMVYLSPIDSLIIGSLIKGLLFWVAFTVLFRTFKIYDMRYIANIGVLSFIILFFFPFVIDYYYILDNDINIGSFSNYIQFLAENTEITTIPGFSKSSGLFSYTFYTFVQIILYLGITVGVAFIVGAIPYSNKHEKFYKKSFKIDYNVYKTEGEYLEQLKDNPDFRIIHYFLHDDIRFTNAKAQKGTFIMWSIPDEEEIIVEINGKQHILTKDESMVIKDLIDKRFHQR